MFPFFSRQPAVPVVADAGGQCQVRLDLELVLQEQAKLVGPVVAVGIALQEGGDVVARRSGSPTPCKNWPRSLLATVPVPGRRSRMLSWVKL